MDTVKEKELTMVQMSKESRDMLKEIAARLRMKMPEAAELIVRAWDDQQLATTREVGK